MEQFNRYHKWYCRNCQKPNALQCYDYFSSKDVIEENNISQRQICKIIITTVTIVNEISTVKN